MRKMPRWLSDQAQASEASFLHCRPRFIVNIGVDDVGTDDDVGVDVAGIASRQLQSFNFSLSVGFTHFSEKKTIKTRPLSQNGRNSSRVEIPEIEMRK